VRIAIDFDGTIVEQDKPYDQVDGEFRFTPGAKETLLRLKAAGHLLLLWSARASWHHRVDIRLDPFFAAHPWILEDPNKFYATNQARFAEMHSFVERELPGVFTAIDDGSYGKPTVDVFIDDRALRLGGSGLTWAEVGELYGDPT